jgi:signal peptidase I
VTVSGACMEPSLRPGERITLRKSTGPPRVGDVALVRTPRGLRLHRVVFRFRRMIRTKGDQGVFLDPQVSEADVLAVWESDESPVGSSVRVVLSLARLLNRSFTSRPGSDLQGDEAHSDSCDDCEE